jgi:hypothetical protein
MRGEEGIPGTVGSTGFTGYTGYTGLRGEQGLPGTVGSTGFTGYTGYTGLRGEQGLPGSVGSTGFTGYTGYTGLRGEQGIPGTVGSTGFTGYTGYTGIQGPTGFLSITGVESGNYVVWDEITQTWISNNSTSVYLGGTSSANFHGVNTVCIGYNSSLGQQGDGSIAIGYNASINNQANNSIILNANYPTNSITAMNTGLYINPVREDINEILLSLMFSNITKEITFVSRRGEINVYWDGITISKVEVNNVISSSLIQTVGMTANQITISNLNQYFQYPSCIASWGLNCTASPETWRYTALFNNSSVILTYTPSNSTIVITSASLTSNLGVLNRSGGSALDPRKIAIIHFSW